MHQLRILCLVLVAFAITACGFHLRGSYDLPAHLSPLYLDKESMSLLLYKELRSTIRASGAELTEDPTVAASESWPWGCILVTLIGSCIDSFLVRQTRMPSGCTGC